MKAQEALQRDEPPPNQTTLEETERVRIRASDLRPPPDPDALRRSWDCFRCGELVPKDTPRAEYRFLHTKRGFTVVHRTCRNRATLDGLPVETNPTAPSLPSLSSPSTSFGGGEKRREEKTRARARVQRILLNHSAFGRGTVAFHLEPVEGFGGETHIGRIEQENSRVPIREATMEDARRLAEAWGWELP